MPEFKQHKSDELRAMFRSLVRSNCARGYTLETLSAMAEALQEGLANYAADAHLPHGQSADTLTRGVLHLLNDPLNRDFIGDTLERGMQQTLDEFAYLASELQPEPEPQQKSKHPNVRLVMMDNHPVPT